MKLWNMILAPPQSPRMNDVDTYAARKSELENDKRPSLHKANVQAGPPHWVVRYPIPIHLTPNLSDFFVHLLLHYLSDTSTFPSSVLLCQ
jgi:hypothetical protein